MVAGVNEGVLAAMLAAAVLGGLAVAWSFRLDRRLRREVRERRAAEEKLRGLLEQPSVGIFIAQDGRFVYANSRFAEIFGYPAEEITGGLSAVDLAAEADRERVREMVRRALEGDRGACALRLRRGPQGRRPSSRSS